MGDVDGGSAWSLVPAILLRSTGFPVDDMAGLAHPGLARSCDALLTAREGVESLRSEFDELVFGKVLEGEQAAGAGKPVFRAWYRVRRRIHVGRPAEVPATIAGRWPAADAWLRAWDRVLAELAVAEREYADEHARAVRLSLRHLRQVAAGDRFAEAVYLSSPSMHDGLRRYLTHGRPDRIRHIDRKLYGYLQRLATKNETTSFFGPIDHGFVTDDPTAPRLRLTTGEQPVVRHTRMAYWAVRALADTLAGSPDVAPHLVPRLADGLCVTGDGLRNVVSGRLVPLTEQERAVVRQIDGARPAHRVGDLTDLVRRRLVVATVPLPTTETDPLTWLREWVWALPNDCASRAEWLRRLDGYLATAAGFPPAPVPGKARLLSEMEQEFGDATGREARRADGELYGDRLLLHDDARGDISCHIGPELVEELGAGLRDALDLCAGYSVLVQRACQAAARRLVAEPMPYLRFLSELQRTVSLADCLAAAPVARFTERLASIVAARSAGGTVRLSRADIAELSQPIPPGTMASPDVILAAPDVAAIADGRYTLVVGEIHFGAQIWSHLTAFWPDRPALAGALTQLLSPDDRALAHVVHARHQGKAFPLELPGLAVELGGRSGKPRDTVLSAAELEVLPGEQAPTLRSTRTGLPIELYPGDPRAVPNWIFGTPPLLVPPLDHGPRTPRVAVGGAVLWRAGWRLDAAQLDATRSAGEVGSAAAMAAVRALWREHGIARRCYARVPSQRKPFFVDVDSPLAVSYLLANTVEDGMVRLVEMLPEPDDWWLPGGAGGRRGCEWRSTWVHRAGADV